MVLDGMDIVFGLVQMALADWERQDVERYFELAYRDADMQLYVKTNSSRAAEAIAQGFAQMLVERMRLLRAREEGRSRLSPGGRRLLR